MIVRRRLGLFGSEVIEGERELAKVDLLEAKFTKDKYLHYTKRSSLDAKALA